MVKNTDKYQVVDFFAQIAGGNKRLDTRIPRLPYVAPLQYESKELRRIGNEEVVYPEFNEEREYQNFLKEKSELREYYRPFLQNHAKLINTPVKSVDLTEFDFRKETEKDRKDFYSVLAGQGEWEKVKIPHYVGPHGIWNCFYRTVLTIGAVDAELEYVLDFQAVDYVGEVYLNGRLIKSHTGFFAPFSAILTPYIKEGENVLLIVVKNDVVVTGAPIDGVTHYGNKIYGQTHLGYDEPELGWHHCPSGAGIYGKVKFFVCKKQRITDIYVRPDIDNGKITVKTTFYNFLPTHTENKVRYTLQGRNFVQTVFEDIEGKIKQTKIEENFLEEEFKLDHFKLWTTEEPYLYEITVTLLDKDGEVVDEKQTHFGMRKFCIDENSTPKGKFYFNNQRIIMRGANEMGHLMRCVMNNDYEQLIDDILIAKVAGLNFFRYTQRPATDDIYDYFDMLGMFCQTDFPAFLFLRESVLGEAMRQVDEMERLTRNHPCVFIESFCNETADSYDYNWEQYGMGREDMSKFFTAALHLVRISNPDRVIKFCDGDYSPLENEYGLNDFHLYTYWYVSHGVNSGRFEKGWLPPFRTDWMAGCGEYGVDGLDSYELMKKYYPAHWLPKTDDEPWAPNRIAKAQCFGSHKQFFPEQSNIKAWIKESREWQRVAIKKYVHGLRRRVDYVQSSAVHLLIDAWPAGWTKTLVDVDRIPKPAYYAFKEANIPVRLSVRADRSVIYNDETLSVKLFALNDTAKDENAEITASIYFNEKLVGTYRAVGIAESVSATYFGDVTISPNGFNGEVRVVAKMQANGGTTYDQACFEATPRNKKARYTPIILSEKLKSLENLCEGEINENIIFCDNVSFRTKQDELEEKAKNGAKVIIFTDKPINVLDENIIFKIHKLEEELGTTKVLAWHNPENKYVEEFSQMTFKDIYDKNSDCKTLISWFHFDWKDSEEILFDLSNEGCDASVLRKKHKMIMSSKKHGRGEIILTTLNALEGCIGNNPYYDKLFINLIEK